MKRVKNEFGSSFESSNFGFMNFGNGSNALAASTTTMATSTNMQPISASSATNNPGVVSQIINVNQYTNQTYVINNISTGGTSGMMGGLGGQNYSNSYYSWPTSNYNPDLSVNSAAASFQMQLPPIQQHQQLQIQQQQQPMHQMQHQLSSVINRAGNSEDSLGSPFKEMIKTIHECYQRYLSPTVLLKKDLVSNTGSKNSSFNSITNTFNSNSNRLAIGYQNSAAGGMYSNNNDACNTGGGDNFYTNLHEIAEHFRFYAVKLANFLHEISGRIEFNYQV